MPMDNAALAIDDRLSLEPFRSSIASANESTLETISTGAAKMILIMVNIKSYQLL